MTGNRRIKSRAELQSDFGRPIGAWFKANYAQPYFLSDGAPGYSALGNLSHDLNNSMLFFPISKTAEGEMSIIYSLDLAERFDELGEVFETQPLVINLGDRRIDDDRSLSCVHRELIVQSICQAQERAYSAFANVRLQPSV